MSVKIDSTTDSETDVKSALGNQTRLDTSKPATEKVEVEGKPDQAEKPDEKEKVAASGTADDGEDEKSEPGKVDEKPTKSLDKRFSKLTRQRKEAEARAADAERRAAYWEGTAKAKSDPKVAESEAVVKTEGGKSDAEPQPENFESHREYLDARMDWKLKQADVERARKASEEATKSAQDNMWKSYSEKEKSFEKRDELVERIEKVRELGIKMSPIVEDRIITTGPELAYELMKDPDEFKALCAMSPNDALEHIGVVKAQLKASKSDTKPVEKVEVVRQPKPVSTVGSRAVVIKDPEKMSMKEYDAWRRAGNSPNG